MLVRKQKQSAYIAYTSIMKMEAVHYSETLGSFYTTSHPRRQLLFIVDSWKEFRIQFLHAAFHPAKASDCIVLHKGMWTATRNILLGIYGFVIDFKKKRYFTENKHLRYDAVLARNADLFVCRSVVYQRESDVKVSVSIRFQPLSTALMWIAECGLPPSQKTQNGN
jgi:hypothetical protein